MTATFARIYNYVRAHVADVSAADDLVSRIFERVLGGLGSFRPERGSFEAWLFTVGAQRHQRPFPVLEMDLFLLPGRGSRSP